MDVLGGERLAQALLQVNELFVSLFVNPSPNPSPNPKSLVATSMVLCTKTTNSQ